MLRRARRIKYTPQVRPAARQKKNYADAPQCGALSPRRRSWAAVARIRTTRRAAPRQRDAIALHRLRVHAAALQFTQRSGRVAALRGAAIRSPRTSTHEHGIRRDSCRLKRSVSTAHARICTRYARVTALIPELEPIPVYGSDRTAPLRARAHAQRTAPRPRALPLRGGLNLALMIGAVAIARVI